MSFKVEIYETRRDYDNLVEIIKLPFVPFVGLTIETALITKTITRVRWDNYMELFKVYCE